MRCQQYRRIKKAYGHRNCREEMFPQAVREEREYVVHKSNSKEKSVVTGNHKSLSKVLSELG